MVDMSGITAGAAIDTQRALGRDRLAERAVGLQERGLDLRERQFAAEQDNLIKQEKMNAIKAYNTNLKEVMEVVAKVDLTTEQGRKEVRAARDVFARMVERYEAMSEKVAPQLSGLGKARLAALDAEIANKQTQDEQARAKGEAKLTEAETITGGKLSDNQKADLAGIGGKSPNTQNYRLPNGDVVAVDLNAPGASERVAELIARGAIEFGVNVQASTISGIGAVEKTDEKRIKEIRASLDKTQGNIEEVEKVIADFRKNPEAGGLAGTVIENVGGLIQQIPVLGDAAVKAAGVDPAEVARIRTRARLVVARLLETVTQETSGRFTDTERDIAAEIQKTLKVGASNEQIQAAGQQVVEIMQASQVRSANTLLQESNLDLSKAEDIDKFGDILIRNGFTRTQAEEMIVDLILRGRR